MFLKYQLYNIFSIFSILFFIFPNILLSEEFSAKNQISVEISNITFNGNTVIDSEILLNAAKKYIADIFQNQALTLDDMQQLADHISFIYREKGYIVAKAYVPPQELEQGHLKIEIIEGKIDKIIVNGNIYYKNKLIKKYFQSQLKNKIVNEPNLERSLMLINDLPSLSSTMILQKSEQHGAVDVVLNTVDKPAIDFGIAYNNYGSEIVSKNLFSTFFDVTDPVGGVNFNLQVVTGEDINDSYMINTNLSIPINSLGTKLNFDFLKSASVLAEEKVYLNIEGTTEIYGINILHPFIKKRNKSFDLKMGYRKKSTEQTLGFDDQSEFDLNLLYSTLNFNNVDRFLGKNFASLSLSFGNLDSDSLKYDKDFYKLALFLTRIQKLGNYSLILLKTSSQLSSNSLSQMEKTVLGGYYYVRGYEPSLYLGDSGYTFSAEYMFPLPGLTEAKIKGKNLGEIFKFALFIDHGGIYNNDSDVDLLGSKNLTGCGLGFRLFIDDFFDLKFDMGFPLNNIENNDDFSAYVSGQWKFF